MHLCVMIWTQELIHDIPVGNAGHSCGNHIKASCVYMAFNTDSSSKYGVHA